MAHCAVPGVGACSRQQLGRAAVAHSSPASGGWFESCRLGEFEQQRAGAPRDRHARLCETDRERIGLGCVSTTGRDEVRYVIGPYGPRVRTRGTQLHRWGSFQVHAVADRRRSSKVTRHLIVSSTIDQDPDLSGTPPRPRGGHPRRSRFELFEGRGVSDTVDIESDYDRFSGVGSGPGDRTGDVDDQARGSRGHPLHSARGAGSRQSGPEVGV